MATLVDPLIISYEKLEGTELSFQNPVQGKRIYHYTSIGGLQGIIGNKKLRFTDIRYMNDKDEIIAGIESMAKAYDYSEEQTKAILSELRNRTEHTFICCFSLDPDSLQMWNYYTKEVNSQGYNIEFDTVNLVESILRQNPILDGCKISFGIVDYCKDNESEYSKALMKRNTELIKASISAVFLTLIKMVREKNPSIIEDKDLNELEAAVANAKKEYEELPIYFYYGKECCFQQYPAGDYMFFVKRDVFKNEREMRIVVTIPEEKISKIDGEKGYYDFRISNGVLIPYIELEFDAAAIQSITISPTIQSDLVELSLQEFLRYNKYNVQRDSEYIKHSKIPVRF